MISVHRIVGLKAKVSTSNPDSHWLSVTFTEADGTTLELTIFFQTRNEGNVEEARFARELCSAINSVEPMKLEGADAVEVTN